MRETPHTANSLLQRRDYEWIEDKKKRNAHASSLMQLRVASVRWTNEIAIWSEHFLQ